MSLPDLITTPRCRLRPPTMADLEPMLSYVNDPDWARYLPVPQPYLREQGESWLGMQVEADRGRVPIWAIETEAGFTGMTNLIIAEGEVEAELGISLAPACWGRGLAREVLAALMSAAFDSLRMLERLRAYADVRNERSRRLLATLGFSFDGVIVARRELRGESIDDAAYHLSRRDRPTIP